MNKLESGMESYNQITIPMSLLRQKTAEYEIKYPRAMQTLRIGCVHPQEQQNLQNPYTSQLDTEDFRNVGLHCIAVGYATEQICQKLLNRGKMTQAEFDQAIERAVIHDGLMRMKTLSRKHLKSIGQYSVDDIESPKGIETTLNDFKIEGDDNAVLASAGNETGHESLSHLIMIIDNYQISLLNAPLTSLVVHLADDFTDTPFSPDEPSSYKLTQERMGNFPKKYPLLYTQGFGFDRAGKDVKVANINDGRETYGLSKVKCFADWQIIASRLIAQKLQNLIDPTNRQDPELFLLDVISKDLI